MDIVFITALEVDTVIGVYEHERNITQKLTIDLELTCDVQTAGMSDDVNDALDYDAVSKRTRAFGSDTSYFLVEAFAEQLANILLAEFAINHIKLTVRKPGAVEAAASVGVIIERASS